MHGCISSNNSFGGGDGGSRSILQKRKIFRPRFKAHSVQQVNSLGITLSIQSNLRRPCLPFHMSLHLPQLPVTQSKWLQVFGNYPRRTPNFHLHDTLNTVPIPIINHRLTAKFFAHCLSHSKPPNKQIGNYSLADLTTMYDKYKHKRPSVFCCNKRTDSLFY
jgi:hypothetical protein